MRKGSAVAVGSGLLVWCSAWGAPVIELEPKAVDWGRQVQNAGEYTYTIVVKNSGDETLQITNVRAGCSCTKVNLKKQTLAPGESTEMTGALTTTGIEGTMSKGIILTTNDPQRPTAIATLAIRFPINGQGLRPLGTTMPVRWREGALWAYVTVENCEPNTPILIEAMELPEGWDCPQALPITIPPEDRKTITLTRKPPAEAETQAFADLPLTLVTDSAKTPRVQSSLTYRPEPAVPATPAAAVPPPVAQPAPAAPARPAP